jgi:hypothetical protein
MFDFTRVSFIVTSLISNKIYALSEAFPFYFLSVARTANGGRRNGLD